MNQYNLMLDLDDWNLIIDSLSRTETLSRSLKDHVYESIKDQIARMEEMQPLMGEQGVVGQLIGTEIQHEVNNAEQKVIQSEAEQMTMTQEQFMEQKFNEISKGENK